MALKTVISKVQLLRNCFYDIILKDVYWDDVTYIFRPKNEFKPPPIIKSKLYIVKMDIKPWEENSFISGSVYRIVNLSIYGTEKAFKQKPKPKYILIGDVELSSPLSVSDNYMVGY